MAVSASWRAWYMARVRSAISWLVFQLAYWMPMWYTALPTTSPRGS